MCGIAGGWSQSRHAELVRELPRMTGAIAHRGPDDSGSWSDPTAGIALGHRRLSIIDISPAGHQPMVSASGRWAIVFNGEIYNHTALRNELARLSQVAGWRGHSDTETLLAGVEAWGPVAALERCVGMFALALWDRKDRCLWLARDRFGEKPLYYGQAAGAFIFGSELKALRCFPGSPARVDQAALSLYMQYGAVPAPLSIYEGISKLPAGSYLKVPEKELAASHIPDPVAYWDIHDAVREARANPFPGSEAAAVLELERVLNASISGQMISDVPLGTFLSGGTDSSLVTALMQGISSRPVKTFSIGFQDASHDEAPHAAAVAAHLGTEHTEFYVSPSDTLALVPSLPDIYDEPFADSSQIPTVLLSRLTRRHVTVALSGDGGDELFFGYKRYVRALKLQSVLSPAPALLRTSASQLIRKTPIGAWDGFGNLISALHLPGGRYFPSGDRVLKLAAFIDAKSDEERYRLLLTYCDPAQVLHEPVRGDTGRNMRSGGLSYAEWMMLEDTTGYLQNDILVKVDRAAMSASLETRVPFLDHRVFNFAWSLPLEMKKRSAGKHVLRELLYKHVPRNLVDRPKRGFSVPLAGWLRGPLRGWAADLLSSQAFRQHPLLDAQAISAIWKEHESGKRDWHYQIWTILMYLAWQVTSTPKPPG